MTRKIIVVVSILTVSYHFFHVRKFIYLWRLKPDEEVVKKEAVPDRPKKKNFYMQQVMDSMNEDDEEVLDKSLTCDEDNMRIIPSSFVKIYLDDLRGRSPKIRDAPKFTEDVNALLEKDVEKLKSLKKFMWDPNTKSILNLDKEILKINNFFRNLIVDAYFYFGFPHPLSICGNFILHSCKSFLKETGIKVVSACSSGINFLEDLFPPFKKVTQGVSFVSNKIVDGSKWVYNNLKSSITENEI